MIIKLLSLSLLSLADLDLDFPFSCSSYICQSYEQADSSCNLLCMSAPCNFDSSDVESGSWYWRFISSGCFSSCLDLGCTSEMLENSVCDTECNNQECGYDLGICGYCASNCTKDMLLNGAQDSECNTQACMYDNNAYGWCNEGCFQSDLNSTTCKSACDNSFCNYQNLICDDSFCAPGCSPEMQNDTICYNECNNEACDYNNWVCACSTGCPLSFQYDNSSCYSECDNKECGYQNGTCGYCASGCFVSMMGDDNCDSQCNVAECNYDWGDCGCSAGCNSKYDKKNKTWNWQDGCKYECLVEDCLYNYGDCIDEFLIRSAWFSQLLQGDSGLVLDFSICIAENCLQSDLEEIDYEYLSCISACNIKECMYCMGLGEESLTCTRSADEKCLLCKDTKQIYDYCFSGLDCPDGYTEVPELYSTFLNTEVCLREPTKYSWNNYYNLYISIDGDNSQSGSEDAPLRTLHYALQKATRKFTKILIEPGDYEYTKESIHNPISNFYSPLEFSISLGLEELWIEGTDENNRPVIYIVGYPMKIYSLAKSTYIRNIVFNGLRALNGECSDILCAYCAYYFNVGSYYLDDHYFYIEDLSLYSSNCDNYKDSAFIITDSETYLSIENTDFTIFGQQLNAVIKSSGSVWLYNVNFENIITDSEGAAINLESKSSYTDTNFDYIFGNVTKINNGYEYTTDKYQGGFIKINGYNNIYISSVNFDYNMIITGIEGNQYNYLIYLKNILGTITIEYCIFSNSFLNGIVYLDDSSLTYSSYTIDFNWNIVQFSQMHFKFSNNQIRNVGTLVCVVKTSSKAPQNIYISDVLIKDIAANGEGVFIIENTSSYSSTAVYGGWSWVKVDGIYIVAYETSRLVEIKNIEVDSSYFGGNFILLSWNPNVNLENINAKSVNDVDYTRFNELVIIKFKENPDMYLEFNLSEGQITDYPCAGLISIYNTDNGNFTALNIVESKCSNGQNGLFAKSLLVLNMNLFAISSSIETSSNEAVLLADIDYLAISNLTFTNISKTESSLFKTIKVNTLHMSFISSENIESIYKSGFQLESSEFTTIYNFDCNNCSSGYGDGGALFIIPATKNSIIHIEKFYCGNCYAKFGSGGALFLDSYSASLYHKLYINEFFVIDSEASDGVAIFISTRFSFEESTFSSIIVSGCISREGGIITDFHKLGTTYIQYYYSEDNFAYYAGVKGGYTTSGLLLYMEYVWITRPLSISSAFYFYSIKDDSNVKINKMLVTNSTNTTILESSKVNFEISEMYIDSGQGIYLYNSQLDIVNTTFTNLYGYAIAASSNSAITCLNCYFINIYGSSALIFDSGSYFTITNSQFFNIYSEFSPSVLSMSACMSDSIFIHCEFIGSFSYYGGLISLQGSSLAIDNCEIRNNTSEGMNSGISMVSSLIKITNTSFYDQTGVLSGFLYLSTKSTAIIIDSNFIRGSASESGGAIYNVMSQVTIKNCFFSENSITSEFGSGGALNGITSAQFYIENSVFENNKASYAGSTIYFTGDALEIYNTVFVAEPSNGGVFMIYAENSKDFIFEDSTIKGNMIPGIYIGYIGNILIKNSHFLNTLEAISITSSNLTQETLYKIENSTFSNNSAQINGGALNLYDVSISISNTLFSNNSAQTNGGALYLFDTSISISNTEFLNNSAINGGGIYFECPDLNCGFQLSSCTFQDNHAELEGGAIKWQDKKPIIDENTIFLNNTALYGGDFASIPARLGYFNSRQLYENAILCTPALECQQEIIIELLDSIGNIMVLDNSSTAVMSISPNSKNSQSYSVSGIVKVTAINGIFTFNSFIISGEPETNVNISISTSTIDPSLGIEAGDTIEYSDSIFFIVDLTACEIGQQIIVTGCSTCLTGTYILEPQTYCITCPTGGNCTGGWKIYVESGYWKPYDNATVVYQCLLSAACLGSTNETDFVGSCATGYEGKKCFSCIVGYTKSGTSKCAKCPSQASNAVILIFLLFFIIFVGVVLVRSTIKSAYSPKALHSIYIKIFTNYIQLVFLTTQFELEWPWFVTKLFSAQTTVATASDKIFSLDCYFSGSNVSYESTYYTKLIVTAITPIIIWTIGLIVWIFICLSKHSWKYLKRELLTTEIVLFFLVYPNIVKFMFTAFSCTYIEGQGFYMRDNLIIKCWSKKHIKYTMSIAFPSIIIWAVGIPTIVLIILTKRRRYLKNDANKVIFGFIFNGYKHSRFFWEFLIMYRKILIICVSVFMTQVAEAVQALTLIVILVVTLYLQYEYRPYNKNQLNHMEMEAILTATITIYCGMYYLTQEIGEEFSIILFVLIVCGNFYFIVYWGYFMLQAVFDMLSGMIPLIRKMTGKNDPYPCVVLNEKKIHQGVFKDEEEGIYKFTLIEKAPKDDLKLIKLNEIKKIGDLYKEAFNRYINRLNYSFGKINNLKESSFEKPATESDDSNPIL